MHLTLACKWCELVKVIPVIDVKEGLVVHAMRGFRELYKPLSNSIYGTCDPFELIAKLVSEGFKTIYVADLDSIEGKKVNDKILNFLRKLEAEVIADIGIDSEEKLKSAIELIDYPVVATESAPSLSFLHRALKVCGERAFLSLDIKSGVVVSKALEIAGKSMEEVEEFLSEVDVRKVILIDFDRIGSCSGPNIDGAKRLARRGFETYVGGGIRDFNDIIELRKVGASGVLVSSALHSGVIKARDLMTYGFRLT